jgi:hypothetical protein
MTWRGATRWLPAIGAALCLLLPAGADAEEIPQVVSLTANPSPAAVGGKTKITASISPLNSAYTVVIRNRINEDGVAGCRATTTSCSGELTIPWSENAEPKDLQLEAEVIPNYGSPTGNGTPLTVPVQPFEWQFTLKATKNPVAVGESTTLETVGIYPDTAWTGYHTKIWNDDTGQLITTCFGHKCTPTLSFPYSMQMDAGAVPVHAEIIRESAPYDVAGRADMTLLVDPLRFGLDMTFSDPQTDWKGERTWKATVSATPKLLNTPFTVSVQNINGGTPGGCVLYGTCSYRLGPGTWRATIVDEEGIVHAATQWWTVPSSSSSSAEPREESADGFNLVTLAAMFPSATAACDAILLLPGTHLANSSVTDQYLACDAAVSTGASTAAALRAAAAAAGGTAILWLLWEEQTREQTDPEQFEPEEESEPLPVPPLIWPEEISADAEDLRELNPEKLSSRDSEVVARQCFRLTTRAALPTSRCTELPIFASGDLDVPQATKHDLEALLHHPAWARLNYEGSGKPGESWYRSYPACEENSKVLHCDEFPFFSTIQGGGSAKPRPSLKLIDGKQNTRQGSKLGRFYAACGVNVGMGKPFLNVPMPPGSHVPTLILCNSNS